MIFYWLLALAAGVAGVIQNGVNKKLAPETGFAFAIHVSNMLVLVGGIVVLFLISTFARGEIAELLKLKIDPRHWTWWLVVPGLMGLFFIVVAPIAITRLGALQVFVAIVFGEVCASGLWDHFFEGKPIDRYRIIGCTLTLVGAYTISLSKA